MNALDAEVQQMIGAISSYSLIERQPTNNTFTIPSTIHLWLRESRDDTQLEDRLWDAFRLISKSVSKEPQVSEDFTFERRIPIHLHACWKNIHDHFRPQDLKHYPNTLPMYHAACLLSRQGMWTDAKDIFWRIMTVSKRVLGLEHPATLNSMFNLAAVYVNTGRWTDAEEFDCECFECKKEKTGPWALWNNTVQGMPCRHMLKPRPVNWSRKLGVRGSEMEKAIFTPRPPRYSDKL